MTFTNFKDNLDLEFLKKVKLLVKLCHIIIFFNLKEIPKVYTIDIAYNIISFRKKYVFTVQHFEY